MAQLFSLGHIRAFMKPSHIFGIVVRVIGVLCWVAAFVSIVTSLRVFVEMGMNWGAQTFATSILPAIGYAAAGFPLIRPGWLVRFSYPDETDKISKDDHVA